MTHRLINPCKIPQNKIETIPVKPRASANKNEHQDIRKNNAVSIVAIPSKRTNLNYQLTEVVIQ